MWINTRNKKLQLLHYAVEQLYIKQIKKAYSEAIYENFMLVHIGTSLVCIPYNDMCQNIADNPS